MVHTIQASSTSPLSQLAVKNHNEYFQSQKVNFLTVRARDLPSATLAQTHHRIRTENVKKLRVVSKNTYKAAHTRDDNNALAQN